MLLLTCVISHPLLVVPLEKARTPDVTSMLSQQTAGKGAAVQLLASASAMEPCPSALLTTSVPTPPAPGTVHAVPVPVVFQVAPVSVQFLSSRVA